VHKLFISAIALTTAVTLAPSAEAAPAAPERREAGHERAAAAAGGGFTVASFNVAGAKRIKGRSTTRSGALAFLRKHRVTVAGLQELQGRTLRTFARRAEGHWRIVGAPGRRGLRSAVVFRPSHFALLQRRHLTITSYGGRRVNVPQVQLRERATGQQFWLLNTHHPAYRKQARWRLESLRRALVRIDRLRDAGHTVLFTGDMNATRGFFCRATRSGMLHSASGGSVGTPCRYPARNGIDWVLGTRDVAFSGWRKDGTTRSRRVSDHPIVVARASLS
jgi:endonuclease/exonuclease/phosphatase family metal-dependent hydrolase